MKNKNISVIIPNFNGEKLLEENIPFVLKAKQYYENFGQKCEIIVVDDASKDNSIKFLKKFPNIKTLELSKNSGYSEAVHSGVKLSEYNYIFLLNNDVKIPENIFFELIKAFEFPNTFAVSPVITNREKRVSSGSYKVPFFKRGELKFRKWRHLDFQKERFLYTLFCSGGSVLIDKKKFLHLQGFHPIFKPFYYEDTDLGIRAWKKNWKSYFASNVSVIHDHQSTINKFYKKFYIKTVMRRNRFFLLWSNLQTKYLLFVHCPNIFLRIISYSLKLDFSYIAGLLKALRYLRKVAIKRKNEAQNIFEISEKINRDFNRLRPL